MIEQNARRGRGRPRGSAEDRNASGAQALARGLAILTALAKQSEATLTDLSLTVGMPPSTAHRLLTTLQAQNYVDFDETTNLWRVGIEAFRTGSSFLRRTSIAEAAQDALQELVAATGETANLAVPDGADVVFVAQVECSHPVRAFFAAGTRTPMHASGIGKALLAAFDKDKTERLIRSNGLSEFTPKTLSVPSLLFDDLAVTRSRGWSFDDEERHMGMRCVAAVIRDAAGAPVGGISVSGPSQRFEDMRAAALGPLVQEAASKVMVRLGGAQEMHA